MRGNLANTATRHRGCHEGRPAALCTWWSVNIAANQTHPAQPWFSKNQLNPNKRFYITIDELLCQQQRSEIHRNEKIASVRAKKWTCTQSSCNRNTTFSKLPAEGNSRRWYCPLWGALQEPKTWLKIRSPALVRAKKNPSALPCTLNLNGLQSRWIPTWANSSEMRLGNSGGSPDTPVVQSDGKIHADRWAMPQPSVLPAAFLSLPFPLPQRDSGCEHTGAAGAATLSMNRHLPRVKQGWLGHLRLPWGMTRPTA